MSEHERLILSAKLAIERVAEDPKVPRRAAIESLELLREHVAQWKAVLLSPPPNPEE